MPHMSHIYKLLYDVFNKVFLVLLFLREGLCACVCVCVCACACACVCVCVRARCFILVHGFSDYVVVVPVF